MGALNSISCILAIISMIVAIYSAVKPVNILWIAVTLLGIIHLLHCMPV